MHGIGCESGILKVKPNSSHRLISHDTFFDDPLKGSRYAVLNFVNVPYPSCDIDEQIGVGSIWAETPDFIGFVEIPLVCILQIASSLLPVLVRRDLFSHNVLGELLTKRNSASKDSVVFVGGLREADL